MTKFMKSLGVAALLAGSAFGTAALADASTTTCGDFAAMDDAGRLTYAHDLLIWIHDTANFEAAGPALTGRYAAADTIDTDVNDVLAGDFQMGKGWTHQQMKVEIEAHCIKQPGFTNIVQALKDHT